MKLKSLKEFINESKINIAPELDKEIEELINSICKNPKCNQIDLGYVEMEIDWEVNPNSNNEEWKRKIGIVFFPELLSYGDPERNNKVQRVPWIACRLTLDSDSSVYVNGEEDQDVTGEILKLVLDNIKGAGYKPFMDEDATWNHWKREQKKYYTEYTCFVNPSYPDGFWENHALE